jgi:hypothetical protein
MITVLRNTRDRQVMQRLTSGEWKMIHRLDAEIGDRLLSRLIGFGWVEQRRQDGKLQIRISPFGREALKAKLPEFPFRMRPRGVRRG